MKKLNEIAIWCQYKDYGDWCYNYRIPTKEEFVEGFKYEFAELTSFRTKKDKAKPFIKKDGVLVKNESFHISIDIEIEPSWKEYIVGNNSNHKWVQKWLESYLETGYIRVKKAKKNNMNKEPYISKTEKSKYKLNFDIIKPNLKILSNLYEKSILIKKNKDKVVLIFKKIIPKHLTIIDTITKYICRHYPGKGIWTPIQKPIIKQLEKSPNRLVYIATKDRKQIARVPWWEANGPKYLGLPDNSKEKWEFISKKEGKRFLRPVAGNSLTAALGDQFYKHHDKYTPPKSSTKVASNKSKRSHPGRVNIKKVISEYDVTLTKHNPNSVGDIKETTYKIKANSKQGAIDKAWNELVPIKVNLKGIKPYYKAVAERSIKSDIIDQPKGNHSVVSSLEAKKQVLITKMKDGNKKIEEITTYERKYPELHPPWKKGHPPYWKPPFKKKRNVSHNTNRSRT